MSVNIKKVSFAGFMLNYVKLFMRIFAMRIEIFFEKESSMRAFLEK